MGGGISTLRKKRGAKVSPLSHRLSLRGLLPNSLERELKSSEFLHYIGMIGFFVTIDLCYPHGMMECWNIGVVRIKSGKNRFSFSSCQPIIPVFHYSNIPLVVKRTLERSKILFSERNGTWATNPRDFMRFPTWRFHDVKPY